MNQSLRNQSHFNRVKASIIIPVYNDADELKLVLSSLKKQSIEADKFEIIVVDNGSTDITREVANSFENVIYLLEDEYLSSPYSCRNRGIEIAKGEIIVLLDGTCIPDYNWLEAGLKCLELRKADLVSSNVKFDFRGKVTAGKVYDSNNLSTEQAVKSRGIAKTASLFIRKIVFDKIGIFPEGLRSGGDVRWTSKATDAGFKLEFCHDSIAWKKARTYLQSIKKQWRVGKGQPAIWRERNEYINPYKKLVSSLIPNHPRKIERLASGKGVEVSKYVRFKLYFVAYSIWIVMSVANIYGDWLWKKKNRSTSSNSSD